MLGSKKVVVCITQVVVCLILLFAYSPIIVQTSFTRIYPGLSVANSQPTSDGGTIHCGALGQTPNSTQGFTAIIFKADANGNQVWSTVPQNQPRELVNAGCTQLTGGNIAFWIKTNGRAFSTAALINSTGSALKTVNVSVNHAPLSLTPTSAGGFLSVVAGVISKFDADFNQLWSYNVQTTTSPRQKITELNDGTVFAPFVDGAYVISSDGSSITSYLYRNTTIRTTYPIVNAIQSNRKSRYLGGWIILLWKNL